MATTHTDNAQCLFCGHQWKLSIVFHSDLPIDKVIAMSHKYMVKKQDILLHKLQHEMAYYLTKLEAK